MVLGSWEKLLGGVAWALGKSQEVGSRVCSGQRVSLAMAETTMVRALWVICDPSCGNIYLYLFQLVDLPQPILKCINPRYYYL
jgi:hypothetical protein